ncbi:MAG: inner membrane CreD family protein [Chthoniobacterales bacterium]
MLVGAALYLFYLALLSVSELIGFTASYAIATFAATGLIIWYCSYFLGGGARFLMIGGGLIGVYRRLATSPLAR